MYKLGVTHTAVEAAGQLVHGPGRRRRTAVAGRTISGDSTTSTRRAVRPDPLRDRPRRRSRACGAAAWPRASLIDRVPLDAGNAAPTRKGTSGGRQRQRGRARAMSKEERDGDTSRQRSVLGAEDLDAFDKATAREKAGHGARILDQRRPDPPRTSTKANRALVSDVPVRRLLLACQDGRVVDGAAGEGAGDRARRDVD